MLSLIALATATLHFSFTNFAAKKKRENELFRIKQTIFWAQDLMISSQLSSKIVLKQTPEGLELECCPIAPLPEKLLPFSRKYLCKGIRALAFNEQKVKELTLHFDAHLGCTSRGVIKLTDNKEQEYFLPLKGFPSRLAHA